MPHTLKIRYSHCWKPVAAWLNGEEFNFHQQRIKKGQFAYVATNLVGTQVVHSGTNMVAVFDPDSNVPTMYLSSRHKQGFPSLFEECAYVGPN